MDAPATHTLMPTPPRLAVLIDADNAQASVIENVLQVAGTLGIVSVKRIYGDFTIRNTASWKKALQKHAIKPVLQFAYTKGKNSTDICLVIDAMDLLHSGMFEGFCLVSSDSDFTGLAMRIREQGLLVYGFGEDKTPESFRNACHRFILIDSLKAPAPAKKPKEVPPPAPAPARRAAPKAPRGTPAEQKPRPPLPVHSMLKALEASVDGEGWSQLSSFSNELRKLEPGFDITNFGYRKLLDLLKSQEELFVIREHAPPGAGRKQFYVRTR